MRAAVGRTGGSADSPSRRSARSRFVAGVLILSAYPPIRLSAQVDRAKPPALTPPPALKLPAVQTAALANGLEVAVVEMHKVPVVDMQLVLDAGAARDPADLPGLATFTATMLQQGAGRRGALEIARSEEHTSELQSL